MPEQNSGGAVFDQWAIVDVMGHQRYVGKVTEQVIAGCGFVRVDIPETEKAAAWTKLIGTGSIYTITPVSEEIARHMATRQAAPVDAYDLQRLTQSTLPVDPLYEDDDDDLVGTVEDDDDDEPF